MVLYVLGERREGEKKREKEIENGMGGILCILCVGYIVSYRSDERIERKEINVLPRLGRETMRGG